ncbi:MAG: PorT family protein [Prevotella sp.]|nr:PorT family protein [Prevotella sp.]
MKLRFFTLLYILAISVTAMSQERRPQNKPYIDLRPLHFGISVGFHIQDIELQNVGPQIVTHEDGTTTEETVVCDQDNWNPGFSVGVLADQRLSKHLSVRLQPTMHFGAKHLVLRHLNQTDAEGHIIEKTQDMKNTYIAFPVDLKFAAERFNNYRPYLTAGVNPMINLTSKSQDAIQLKRFDTMLEIGMGCDLYLPFFKLIPELKFSYSLTDCIDHGHADELTDATQRIFTNSVTGGHAKMITLTLYFE